MADYEGYSPRNRVERVISAGRLFLAIVLTSAVIVEPTEPRAYAELIRIITTAYLAYAVGLAALTWTRQVTTFGVPIVTHTFDLAIFSVLILFTDGSHSPFFSFLVFATICGAIRWHGRGALLTGAACTIAYVASTVAGSLFLEGGSFHVGRFIGRCALLVMVAGLLAYLGAFQYRLQREISSLAAWPRRLPTREHEALAEVLAYAARVLGAPRLVLAWEEGDEPSLRIARREGDQFDIARERPDAMGTLVAEPLQRSSFACMNIRRTPARVLQRVQGGFRFWSGEPFDPRFGQRFDVRSVAALRLSSENVHGWLFAFDLRRASADDLLLGDIVGRLVAGALELQTLLEQLRESAAGEERVHLARELHDGVLQSLTAASLQAQRARQSVGTSPAEAERRLAMVEETILSEQQALRLAIEDLKPGAIKEITAVDVIPRLREVATRVGRQWDIRTNLNFQRDVPPLPRKLAHELTRMLQEALVNAIRHGAAKEVTVTCIAMGPTLAMSVSYQGRGFAGFQGRHDLASLNRMKAGPRTLKERVAAVGGSLEVESGEGGARVEIRVPLMAVG